MNRSGIAWKFAENFNNSFKRIQTLFHRLSLGPFKFFLFPKMKIKLKGLRFDTVDTQAETQQVLNTLTKKHFQEAFQKWQKLWDQCVHSQGDYFERAE
jgi:hypothetical protein